MYDLDEVDATEDAVDEVPEFMKPDDVDIDAEPETAEATETTEATEPDRTPPRGDDDKE
jgi:hypothetical protein